MVKLVGILMIGMSAALIGYQMSALMKKRIDLLCTISFILEEISNEACYGKEILPEIIKEISMKTGGREKEWLCVLHEKLEESGNHDFTGAWKESLVFLGQTALKAEDLELISNFGSRIINLNEDRLLGIINNQVLSLNEHINKLKAEYDVKARLYRSMGILTGLFIIIIVI